MANQERRSMISRWLEGKEQCPGRAQPHSVNRMTLFWDLWKGRLGRLMLVNLILLISMLPFIILIVLRFLTVSAQDMFGPFGAGLNIGYPALPDVVGFAERSVFYSDLLYFSLFIPASVIGAAGLSGGMFLIGNLIRSEGVFEFKDFLRGIKQSYFSVLETLLLFTLILFLARLTGNYADWQVSIGSSSSGFLIASKVIGYLILACAILICMWMLSIGVNYKQGPFSLLRSAVVMSVGVFPQTLIFAAAATAPIFLVLFVKNNFLFTLSAVLFAIFGFSWFMLIWMNFSQWAFEKFVAATLEPAVKSGVKAPKIPTESHQKNNSDADARRILLAFGKSNLISRPIQPIDEGSNPFQLPDFYSREDLQKLEKSRIELQDSLDQYEAAHRNEARYIEYNRQFQDRDKALESGGKGKKLKHPPKMLNR